MDAFEEFDTKSFVSRLLGKGDMKKLVEKLGDIVPEDKQMEMMEQMQKGNMSMRTFRSLMEQFSSAGPMSSVRPAASTQNVERLPCSLVWSKFLQVSVWQAAADVYLLAVPFSSICVCEAVVRCGCPFSYR